MDKKLFDNGYKNISEGVQLKKAWRVVTCHRFNVEEMQAGKKMQQSPVKPVSDAKIVMLFINTLN